jgi:hypothetical protein
MTEKFLQPLADDAGVLLAIGRKSLSLSGGRW